LACILSVDKNRQMALEFKKIDNEYLENNAKKEFWLPPGHIRMNYFCGQIYP
jgi:hypothetical protein